MWNQIKTDYFECSCCEINFHSFDNLCYGYLDNQLDCSTRILCEYCFPFRDDLICQECEEKAYFQKKQSKYSN